eukprot:COSAG02_NODE_2272_length_9263_cov_212.913902_3_plen_466_part_00
MSFALLGSVRNQRENILMLVANLYRSAAAACFVRLLTRKSRQACLTIVCAICSNIEGENRKARAVQALHHHTLSSYENWAMNMHALRRANAYGRSDDGDPGTQTQIYEVVLWWCIWGEAANMRFIPEFLSWVFWSLVQRRDEPEEHFGRYEDGQGFLRHVMRPMYKYVSKEAFKKDQAGNNCDHSQKKNLDDINEYFWRRRGDTVCTKFSACGEGMTEMIRQLEQEKKTYVERRGLLHSVKSNLRVFTVYICLFHLIVTVAHFVPFEQNTLPLCPPQTRVDSCQGADEEDECKRMSSCNWDNPPTKEDDGQEDGQEHCYDPCQWCIGHEVNTAKDGATTTCDGNLGSQGTWVRRPSNECTDGCKWNTESEDPIEPDGGCHMFTSKSSRELLDAIETTTYFNCDLGTGICRYRDSKNKPVEYSCLQRLTPGQQEDYLALNAGKWWEGGKLGVTGECRDSTINRNQC